MKIKTSLIILLTIIALSFLGGRLSLRSTRNAQNNALVALRDEIVVAKVTIDGFTNTVWSQSQIILDQRQALELELVKKEEPAYQNASRSSADKPQLNQKQSPQ